jgi:hypothetical protein
VPLGLAVLALAFLLFRKRGGKGSSIDGVHQDLKLPEGSYFEQERQSEIDGRQKHEIDGEVGPEVELEWLHSFLFPAMSTRCLT